MTGRLSSALLIAVSSLLVSHSTAFSQSGMDNYIDSVLRMGVTKPNAPMPSGRGRHSQIIRVDRTFGGYDCSGSCSGHKAGFKWAKRNDVNDEDECVSNSTSFNEGCAVYIDDPNRDADLDDDGNYIPYR